MKAQGYGLSADGRTLYIGYTVNTPSSLEPTAARVVGGKEPTITLYTQADADSDMSTGPALPPIRRCVLVKLNANLLQPGQTVRDGADGGIQTLDTERPSTKCAAVQSLDD